MFEATICTTVLQSDRQGVEVEGEKESRMVPQLLKHLIK